MAESFEQAGDRFGELVRVMARLRAPGGCPWDRKQTFDTIKAYLLEESYEVMDAIDRRDWRGLEEELGDLLLQPVFLAEMAEEQGLFSIADSLDAINRKLVRRHPHVFGDAQADTPDEVKLRWDEIKKQEKAEQGTAADASVLYRLWWKRKRSATRRRDSVSNGRTSRASWRNCRRKRRSWPGRVNRRIGSISSTKWEIYYSPW
jgi:uncharacterized protein YabN with tetrapyrrole methylase and pyrophosphatase domain